MRTTSILTLLISSFSLFSTSFAFANNPNPLSSVEFFVSNNTGEIDIQTAFNRLEGNEQQELQNTIVDTMQKKHIEQGTFADLLGTYQMSNGQTTTADNSEGFITSPYQKISNKKVFNIAKELANTLNQESVAVFISSNQSTIGDTILKFKANQYSINETIQLIHQKLPQLYSQAFSLHLMNTCDGFYTTTVKEVEWLGSKVDPQEIQKSFPNDEVVSHNGEAYLVYKDGRKEPL